MSKIERDMIAEARAARDAKNDTSASVSDTELGVDRPSAPNDGGKWTGEVVVSHPTWGRMTLFAALLKCPKIGDILDFSDGHQITIEEIP